MPATALSACGGDACPSAGEGRLGAEGVEGSGGADLDGEIPSSNDAGGDGVDVREHAVPPGRDAMRWFLAKTVAEPAGMQDPRLDLVDMKDFVASGASRFALAVWRSSSEATRMAPTRMTENT